MRQSLLALRTDKNAPHDADSINAQLLTRGGFVKKEMAGVYSYLPLGVRVLKKIKQIIHEEMQAVDAQEVLMPIITPRENWETTGRADIDIAYTPTDNTILAWSHEEMVTPIAKDLIRSYRNLPVCLYHIQYKFRNEPRAKSGLLRGREFIMKDAYSFHASKADFESYYEKMAGAYFRVYERCGLKAYRIASGGGDFSQNISHEFSVVSPAGEDKMVICPGCAFAQNRELDESLKNGSACPTCGQPLQEETCVEVGNIFDLGSKYSDAFEMRYTDAEGKLQPIHMGCYGIGVSRLMGTIAEVFHDDKGIIWPKTVAPFQIHLISLKADEIAARLVDDLEQEGYSVLFDDRSDTAGTKFADADLIGIPLRIVVSPRTLEANAIEARDRATGETTMIPLEELSHRVWEFFTLR